MNPDMTRLLDLQAKDLELYHVERQLQQLDTELAELDEQLSRAREGVTAAQRAIDVDSKRRDDLEATMEAHRKHQDKRREKLEFMRTPREVAGLMAEIDLAKGALSTEENEWVKVSDQVAQAEMRKADAEQVVQGIERDQATIRSRITEKRQDLERERQTALERREASAREVRRPLLQRYEKLRNAATSRTLVVVPLSGAACGSCFTTVPLSRRNQIKGGTVIEGCESCGVILYSPE